MNMWTALEAVQMKEYVQALPGGLDAAVSEGGGNLSVSLPEDKPPIASHASTYCCRRDGSTKSKLRSQCTGNKKTHLSFCGLCAWSVFCCCLL